MKKLLLLASALLLCAWNAFGQSATVTITPVNSAYATGGGTITFNVELNYTGSASALGFEITGVPDLWAFGEARGDNIPDVRPVRGAGGNFEFTYTNVPESPAFFNFTVEYPMGLTAAQVFSGVSSILRPTGGTLVKNALPDITVNHSSALPVIHTHPFSQGIGAGQSRTISVRTTEPPTNPPGVQWKRNGVALPGATQEDLVFVNFQSSNAGTYTADVTVAGRGTTTSRAAVLTLVPPPVVTTQPVSIPAATLGSTVTFTGAASNNPAYSWTKNGAPIGGVTDATLTLTNVSGADVGEYRLVATNQGGSATSNPATLGLAPGIGSFTPASGGQNSLIAIHGAGFTGATAVRFNGVAASSFTVVSDFRIDATAPVFATTGPIIVTTAGGATLTSGPVFTVLEGSRVNAIALRASTLGNESALMASFAIEGAAPKEVLVRVIGPSLPGSPTGALADPFLTLYNSAGAVHATNNDWTPTDSTPLALFNPTGAIQLASGSRDAALLVTLQPGTYTARAIGVGGASGLAQIEVFEAGVTQRLAFASTRAHVASGGVNLSHVSVGSSTVAGLKTVLIRAVGVGGGVGTPVAHPNPTITVKSSTGTVLGTNDNWTVTNVSQSELVAATSAVGAMPLGANDSALLLSLAAGDYMIETSGVGATSGVVMTEVHVVDAFRPASFPAALLAPLHDQAPPLSGTVTFAAPFIGKPNPQFQWQKDSANLSGQTGATLTLSSVTAANNGAYRVILVNDTTVTSAAANVEVGKETPVITWPAPAPITYGTALSGTQLNATATFGGNMVPGTFVYTPAAGTVLNAGSTTLSVTFTPTDIANYRAVTTTTSLTVNKAMPVVTWATPSAITYGTALSSAQLNATANVPGSFVYTPAANTVLNAGADQALSVTFTPTDATNYATATGGTTINVNKGTPVLVWNAPAPIAYGTPLSPVQLSAAASFNGSPIAGSFVYTPGLDAVLNAGANQALGVVFTPADSGNLNTATADTTITVEKANQAIAFAAIPSKPLDSGSFTLEAISSSGLPIVYTTSNNTPASGNAAHIVATVSGSTATPLNRGTITVTASQPGDSNYNEATAVSQVLTVLNQSQTVVFEQTQLPKKQFTNEPFQISATSNRGLLVSFASSNTTVATVGASTLSSGVSTATVTILAAGTANITATQAGDDNTAAAPAVTRTLEVEPFPAAIAFAEGTLAQVYDGNPRPVSVNTTPASLNVVITYGAGASASPTAPTNAGTYPVNATIQEANYVGSVSNNLTISPADQTITFPAIASPIVISSGPFELAATASSNLTVAYASSNSAVATVSGATVTILGLGTTTLTASQPGNENYKPATSVPQTLTVTPDAPVIQSIPSASYSGVQGSSLVYGPITVNGGAAPYTFSATGLPAGLSVNPANGNITGTPTVNGAFTVTLVVNNATVPAPAANTANSRTITFNIQPPIPAFTAPPVAPNGTVGTAGYSFTPTVSNAASFTATGLPDGLVVNPTTGAITGTPTVAGTFTVNLTATNVTGSTTVPVTITIALPPNAPNYVGSRTPSGTAGTPFTFTANFGPGAATYSLSGDIPSGLVVGETTGILSWPTPAVGTFPVTVSATRSGVTVGVELTLTINPAATAPVVTFPAGGNRLSLTRGVAMAAVQLIATPSTGATFSATGLPADLSLSGAGLLSGTPNTVGTFDVTLSATNTAGQGPNAAMRIVVDPSPLAPVISNSPAIDGQIGVALSHALTASPAADSFQITSGALQIGLSLTGAAIAGTPTESGVRRIWVAGTNSAGGLGAAQELVVSIRPADTAPVVNSNGTASGNVGQAFTYQITATNGPTGFFVDGTLPPGLAHTAGVISGVPTSVTTTPVTVGLTAENASGRSAGKSLAITVGPALSAPVISSPAATVGGRVGVAFNYQIGASESPTSFSASGLPPGLVLAPSSGVISGTPTQPGIFRATVTAGNANGQSAPSTLTFTLAAAAGAPIIGGAAPSAGRVGTAFSYQIVATPAPIANYALTGALPLGVSLNTNTGILSGTPAESGLFTVNVAAANASGTSLPQPLVINIQPALGVPVIGSANNASATVGVEFTYEILATNVPGTRPFAAPTVLDALNLPAGLAVNPSMGRIQGTPTTVGTVRATLVGTNAAGTGPGRDLVIEVHPAPAAPAVNSPVSATGQVGANFAYRITATQSPTSFEVRNAPAWMVINTATGEISGTPTTPGLAEVVLVARNSIGSSQPTRLDLNIAAAAGTPIIGSTQIAKATVGASFSYSILASPTATSFSAEGLPPGVTINATNGTLTGTPRSSGTYLVKLSARNASGRGYPVTLTLTVEASAPLTGS